MTNEQLDEATVNEARRRWLSTPALRIHGTLGEDAPFIVARLAREGWTPPEPVVDPNVLAFRKWFAAHSPNTGESILAGGWDQGLTAKAYLAGARMAREQERERANAVVAFAVRVKAGVFNDSDHTKREARKVLDEYQGEA